MKCFLCGGKLTKERSDTTLIVFINCRKCGVVSDYYLFDRGDDLKTRLEEIQINDLDLHTEMWIQVKITLAFKLLSALDTQIKEIHEIITTDKHKKEWVRL